MNRELLLPFLVPYFVYVGVASVPWLSREWNYALRIVATAAALLWARKSYARLRGPTHPASSVLWGIAAGLAGLLLWIELTLPFAGHGGTAWEPGAFWLRVAAATLLVPLFEEQLMRGFVLRFVLQWEAARVEKHEDALGEAFERRSIHDVTPGAITPVALGASAVVFAAGHRPAELGAALAYGVVMGLLWQRQRDLLSCVVAHATTNLGLALYVHASGSWLLW